VSPRHWGHHYEVKNNSNVFLFQLDRLRVSPCVRRRSYRSSWSAFGAPMCASCSSARRSVRFRLCCSILTTWLDLIRRRIDSFFVCFVYWTTTTTTTTTNKQTHARTRAQVWRRRCGARILALTHASSRSATFIRSSTFPLRLIRIIVNASTNTGC
jgi:hypothetical protein